MSEGNDRVSEHSQGRVFAGEQLRRGGMDAIELIRASEDSIPQAIERGDVKRAEFWVGVREQAAVYLLQHNTPAERMQHAPFEMVYVSLTAGGTATWFCAREDTEATVAEILEKHGEQMSYLTVKPAYFEEIGALCLTPWDGDAALGDLGELPPQSPDEGKYLSDS